MSTNLCRRTLARLPLPALASRLHDADMRLDVVRLWPVDDRSGAFVFLETAIESVVAAGGPTSQPRALELRRADFPRAHPVHVSAFELAVVKPATIGVTDLYGLCVPADWREAQLPIDPVIRGRFAVLEPRDPTVAKITEPIRAHAAPVPTPVRETQPKTALGAPADMAVHWESNVGDGRAPDREVGDWAAGAVGQLHGLGATARQIDHRRL